MSTLELGQRVRFTHHLIRTAPKLNTRSWLAIAPKGFIGQGILVGVRMLANGAVDRGYDEPTIFVPEERFRAYLISYDLHRRPIFVLPEHVSIDGLDL